MTTLLVKDAKGNTPVELTTFEKKWRDSVKSGGLSKKYEMLRQRQAMPLKEKVEMSLERIWEWGQAFDGNISVGYSGGKDSEILLYLARKVYPDIPAVFCNTGLEYPEILSQVKHTDNVIRLRPRIPFRRVIQDHGWPVISKKDSLHDYSYLGDTYRERERIRKKRDRWVSRLQQTPVMERKAIFQALAESLAGVVPQQ